MVVERGTRIVGCAALFQVWHLEGVWTDTQERGRVSAARHIVRAIRGMARRLRIREVLMMAVTAESRRLCERFGPSRLLACDHVAVHTEGLWALDK